MTLFNRVDTRLEVLAHGNCNRAQALELASHFSAALGDVLKKRCECSSRYLSELRVVDIRDGPELRIQREGRNDKEKVGVLEAYWQICQCRHSWDPEISLATFLEYMLDEPVFDELRTKEQLGYASPAVSRGQRDPWVESRREE